jgi:DNA polymerase III alpha subunit (gram-positive type)
MNFWKKLIPEVPPKPKNKEVLKVNAHLHTPHSFSAFCCVEEAVEQAKEEGVKVVGVNDFFTFDAYDAWSYQTIKNGLFPLFNVEFIGLDEEKKKKGLRVNDPANPGRTYLSGKGLAYPVVLPKDDMAKIKHIMAKNNEQVKQMMAKVNELLKNAGYSFSLDFEKVKAEFAKDQVRERHLARAIRDLAVKQFPKTDDQKAFYKDIFGGKELSSDINNDAAVENEIRSKLLKAGGAAFEEEDPSTFLDTGTIHDIIINAGGIPTYPFLADDAKGNYTDFEGDLPAAMADLI